MEGLNLRGEPSPAEDPPPTEEPLGLDLIRGWLAKPRPRLYGLWLWVPYLAARVRKAYEWLRENGGPALRRTVRALRKTTEIIQALRRAADRLSVRLNAAFPPGSRGREVAGHLAAGSRLLGRSALLLVGIGREADRIPSLREGGRASGERPPEPRPPPSGTGPESAPETRRRPAADEPGPSTGAGPTGRGEPAGSPNPTRRGDPAASPGPARSPTNEGSRPETSGPEPSPPETSGPEPSRQAPSLPDPPNRGSAESAPADSSPVPGVPAGPRADALAALSKDLRVQILTLGKRPRKAALRYTIWWILNERGSATSETLGLALQMDPANLAKRHLSPLVEEGVLKRTIPDQITHPEQAYRATRRPPGQFAPSRRR